MSWQTPERKAERAFLAWMGTLSGVTTRARFSGTTKALPALDIYCDACRPHAIDEVGDPKFWECEMKFRVRTRYEKDDSGEGESHDAIVGQVADMLHDSDLLAGLNAHGATFDFEALRWQVGERRNTVEDQEYVTEMIGLLWLVPVNVT